jgi:hypothetical protein
MEKELSESLNFGVMLAFTAITLLVAVLSYYIARSAGGEFFDGEAVRGHAISVVGLSGLSFTPGKEMPTASLYAMVAREWRNVLSVTVIERGTDMLGEDILIVKGVPGPSGWILGDACTVNNVTGGFNCAVGAASSCGQPCFRPLTDSFGTLYEVVSGPEQVLFAQTGRLRGQVLTGRVVVDVEHCTATLGFHVVARRLSDPD